MKKLILSVILFAGFFVNAPTVAQAQEAQKEFTLVGERIDSSVIADLPIQSNGRIKPFESYARESVLFLTGRYKKFGLDSIQVYLGIMLYPQAENLEIIDLRDPDLREKLGLSKKKTLYSYSEIEKTPLMSLAQPLLKKQEANDRNVTPAEKATIEAFHQFWFFRQIQSGDHLIQGVDFSPLEGGNAAPQPAVVEAAKAYLGALASNTGVNEAASKFKQTVSDQKVPDLMKSQMQKIGLEVSYLHFQPFFWACVLLLLIGSALASGLVKERVPPKVILALFVVPLVLQAVGFAMRVYITSFAPVTNMYGTMLWVAFGVTLFTCLLLALYNNHRAVGLLSIGAGLVLLLTESLPLTLSPDMDPIVAVLRSNYWLTLHVLTITISYAGFTIAMLMGNAGLIRNLLFKDNQKFFKDYAHYTYRMIQLGCFLITAGIILGGIWADYSWGRFWGWDPKETWALIADLGFLTIMHARYVGWLRDFGTLAASTVAYLLVIMAWYGVNFILAAGLHSYGFSSGGATAVAIFVSAQLILLAVSVYVYQQRKQKQAAA